MVFRPHSMIKKRRTLCAKHWTSKTPGRRDYFCPRLFEVAPYDDRMIREFFCLNADFATKAQVNMVSLDLSMAAAQRRHTKGSIGLAYSLLPSRKEGQF